MRQHPDPKPSPSPVAAGLRGLLCLSLGFAAVQAVCPAPSDPEGVALVAALGLAAAAWLGLMMLPGGER